MIVNVERKEVGLFKKRLRTSISITFTEEEKAIVKSRGLQNHWIWEGTVNGIPCGCSLGSMVKGRVYNYDADTVAQAEGWVLMYREGLEKTKALIQANAGDTKKSDTFEI